VRQQLLLNGMYPVGDGPEALAQTLREDTPLGPYHEGGRSWRPKDESFPSSFLLSPAATGCPP
jgi:hypothetical protein